LKDKQYKARYIKAVTKQLPLEQRADIELELNSLIDEQIEQENKSVESVLKALGHPKKFAQNYQTKPRYVIGPKSFDSYVMVLKLVLMIGFIGMSIALVVEAFMMEDFNIGSFILHYIGSLMAAGWQIFGTITLIFFIIERFAKDVFDEDETIDLDELPELEQDAPSKKSERVFNIVVLVIFFVIVNVNPSLLSVFSISNGNVAFAPLFDEEAFHQAKIFFNIAIVVGLVRNSVLLYFQSYNKAYLTINFSLLIVGNLLLVLPFIVFDMINNNLNEQMRVFGYTSGDFDFEHIIGLGLYIFIIVIIITSIIEIMSDLKKVYYHNPCDSSN